MSPYEFFRWSIVILSTSILCSPLFLLIKHKGKTFGSREFKENYPKYSWVLRFIRIFLIAWPLFCFLILYLAITKISGISLIGWFISGYGFVLGSITQITNSSYIPLSIPLVRFVHGNDARNIGRIQLLLSFVSVCVSTYVAIAY